MFDLRGVRRINADLGLEKGDDILRRVAAVLKTALRNNDVIARTFDVWAVGIKPNGQETPPKFGPLNQTLQPGQVYTALNLVQQVPAYVPGGSYTWLAKIGTYPNFVTDTDRFLATKLAARAAGGAASPSRTAASPPASGR